MIKILVNVYFTVNLFLAGVITGVLLMSQSEKKQVLRNIIKFTLFGIFIFLWAAFVPKRIGKRISDSLKRISLLRLKAIWWLLIKRNFILLCPGKTKFE